MSFIRYVEGITLRRLEEEGEDGNRTTLVTYGQHEVYGMQRYLTVALVVGVGDPASVRPVDSR